MNPDLKTLTSASDAIRIECWVPDPAGVEEDVEMLGEVLHACVHAGASVSFVLPFSREDARAFWRDQVLPGVSAGSRCVLLARLGPQIVGTVQLDFATPPNQPHRAEVKKLLVHPDARRRGIARLLLLETEERAREAGRMLLTLDTQTGSSAEPLYVSLGYVPVGVIPRYSLDPASSRLDATTVMYKELSPV